MSENQLNVTVFYYTNNPTIFISGNSKQLFELGNALISLPYPQEFKLETTKLAEGEFPLLSIILMEQGDELEIERQQQSLIICGSKVNIALFSEYISWFANDSGSKPNTGERKCKDHMHIEWIGDEGYIKASSCPIILYAVDESFKE